MRKRGSIFLVVLAVLTMAISILAVTAQTHDIDMKASANASQQRKASMMARAGIQRGLTELALLTQTGQVDNTQEWSTLGTNGDDRFHVGPDTFRLQIVDAASRINLNTAPEQQLLNLGLTQEQVDCLMDWREPGTTPRSDGAKNEFYQALPNPYNAALGRMDTVDELLLVKNFLPSDLYTTPTTVTQEATPVPLYVLATVDSYSPEISATGQPLTDINAAQLAQFTQAGINPTVAGAIIARRNGLGTFSSMSQVLTTPALTTQQAGAILDRFQVGVGTRTEGKINLNTATENVLDTIPNLTADIVQSILNRQTSGFKSMSDIFQIPGITPSALAGYVNQITVATDTFLVRAEGMCGQTTASMEAVVRIENGVPVVEKVVQPPNNDMAATWGWNADTNNDIVLMEATN